MERIPKTGSLNLPRKTRQEIINGSINTETEYKYSLEKKI